MEEIPPYVPIVFILTTFAAIGFLLRAVRRAGLNTFPSGLLMFLLPLWIIFQGTVAIGGVYENFTSVPPRLVIFGIAPAILVVAVYLIFFRSSFVDKLPIKTLTMLHIVRIPVELTLYWLFIAGQVPEMMTFAGRNFDILSGIAAPVIFWLAFRGGETRRGLLIAYNVFGLVLLANIVTIAALSIPSPLQQLNFDQPNRAVLYFPYVWLPTLVVPIVLFAHLASLIKLLSRKPLTR